MLVSSTSLVVRTVSGPYRNLAARVLLYSRNNFLSDFPTIMPERVKFVVIHIYIRAPVGVLICCVNPSPHPPIPPPVRMLYIKASEIDRRQVLSHELNGLGSFRALKKRLIMAVRARIALVDSAKAGDRPVLFKTTT